MVSKVKSAEFKATSAHYLKAVKGLYKTDSFNRLIYTRLNVYYEPVELFNFSSGKICQMSECLMMVLNNFRCVSVPTCSRTASLMSQLFIHTIRVIMYGSTNTKDLNTTRKNCCRHINYEILF